jgi:hypothetical protein
VVCERARNYVYACVCISEGEKKTYSEIEHAGLLCLVDVLALCNFCVCVQLDGIMLRQP